MNNNLQFGSARINELGTIEGGQLGDQTGKEVMIQPFYIHKLGWHIIRHKNPFISDCLAEAMYKACNNNHIGYDQKNRLKVLRDGILSTNDTACDCSSLVRAVILAVTGTDVGNFTTYNALRIITACEGFYDAGVYKEGTVLYDGDILVTCKKGHMGIIVSGNPYPEEPKKEVIPSEASFYKQYTGTTNSIVNALIAVGAPSKYADRKKIAAKNGIKNYTGSGPQNLQMLNILKAGKLKKI